MMRFINPASLFNKMGKIHSKKSYEQLVHADVVEIKSSSKKMMMMKKRGSTPKGRIDFLVGEEEKQYPVPVKYLLHPKLQELLKKHQDPLFDPNFGEPIVLPCSPETFDQVLRSVAKDR